MAGKRALEAVARSVVTLVSAAVASQPGSQRPTVVLVGAGTGGPGSLRSGADVLVHAYAVTQETDDLRPPDLGRPGSQPRMPVRVSFLISPVASDPAEELFLLGLVMRALHLSPIVPPSGLDPAGDWEPDDQVTLTATATTYADRAAVFAALGIAPRPALTFEARGFSISD